MSASTSAPHALAARVAENPDAIAVRKKELGRWRQYSRREYLDRSSAVGGGLLSLGVKVGEVVAVISDSRPAWLFVDVGAQGAGLSVVAVDADAEAADVKKQLSAAKARAVAVVEDEEQLDKVLLVRKGLRTLRHIIVIDPRGVRDLDDPMVSTLAELERLGAAEATAWPVVPNAATTLAVEPAGALQPSDEVLVEASFADAPTRHVCIDIALRDGCIVNFGEGVDAASTDIREIQPTVRIVSGPTWNQTRAVVERRMADASRMKRIAYRQSMAEQGPRWLRHLVLYRSLRAKLGLSRVRLAQATTPLDDGVAGWFATIGVTVSEPA